MLREYLAVETWLRVVGLRESLFVVLIRCNLCSDRGPAILVRLPLTIH
jgi:hypothetical protein